MGHRQVSDGHIKPLHPWYTRLYRLGRLDYLKILRTHGAPAQVARGVGYGIFVELIFFPTLGLGFFLIYPLNKYLKGHLAASIAGFVFAKLFAFLTIAPSFILGSKILKLPDFGAKFMADDKLKPLGEVWVTVKQLFSSGELFQALAGWATGAAVFGVVLGAIGFFFTLIGLKKYQAHRKERREEVLREKEAA
ncbi:MAG: DUF2062 domain-containing protein [Verrucomicrobia subdivision 3 bacterium]|nr:DUF2062 domain-containing protein [Limisphaerales bacterium]